MQTTRLIEIHATPPRNKIVSRAAEKVRDIAKTRERENIFGHIIQCSLRHLAPLRIEAVTKVDQQGGNLRVIETVKGQGNHFQRMGARIISSRRAIVLIEVTRLGIAVPVMQADVVPGIRDVQKTLIKGATCLGSQFGSGDPEQAMSCLTVRHRQRLEIKSLGLGSLAQHLPVMTDGVY